MRAIIHKGWLALAVLWAWAPVVASGDARVIAVLTTRDSEMTALISSLPAEQVATVNRAGRDVRVLQSQGAKVVTARCGAGLVNAVITAQAIIDHFQPELIVSTGLCAALDDEIAIGDLLLAESFDRHDIGSHTDAGFIHGTAPHRITRIDAETLFQDPAEWGRIIESLQAGMSPPVRSVRLVSGDSFIRSDYKRSWIRGKLGADAVDMSGAALAAVAEANQIPLLVLRQVSDFGDRRAGRQFMEAAGDRADRLGEAVAVLIKTWLAQERFSP